MGKIREYKGKTEIKVLVHGSGKHCHLTEDDFRILYGPDAELEVLRYVGADGKGDFITQYKPTVIGPGGKSFTLSLLGPFRGNTQVELSYTEARQIGAVAGLALKGHEGTWPIKIRGDAGEIDLPYGLFIPERHVHLTWEDALAAGIKDGEMCDLRMEGERPTTYHGVVAKVAPQWVGMELSDVHLDYDEFNAASLFKLDGGWLSRGEQPEEE